MGVTNGQNILGYTMTPWFENRTPSKDYGYFTCFVKHPIYVRSKLISSCIYSWSQSIHRAGPEHSEMKKHILWPRNACQHREVTESYSMLSPHLEILTLKKHPHSVLQPYVNPQKADDLSCHRTFTHATQSFWIVFPCCLLSFQILTGTSLPQGKLLLTSTPGQLSLF